MSSHPVKLAVLSHVLPPSPSGQSIVLYRLLRAWDPADYCLLSRQDHRGSVAERMSTKAKQLPGCYYYLSPGPRLPVPRVRYLSAFALLPNVILELLWRTRQISKILRKERCNAVVACSGDIIDIPSGYLASRRVGIAFYVYLFDDFTYQWTSRLYRWFASQSEKAIMPRAAGVIVPNEFLADEYHRRHCIEPVIIHNPTEVDPEVCQSAELTGDDDIRIVYTGSVYHAHFDAFRNLIEAIKCLGRSDLRLHLYTSQSLCDLEWLSISGITVFHPHIPQDEALGVQQQADILFLPLAFNSPIPEIVRTSAPGKMGEYLSSGRPILVHAPPDSFVSWYFREYDCGLVADQNDAQNLACGLSDLISDQALRSRLAANALARAEADFSLLTARKIFRSLLMEQQT